MKKKNHNKKPIIIISLIGLLSFFIVAPKNQPTKQITKKEKHKNSSQKVSRSIASIPTSKQNNRIIVGNKKNINNVNLINKVNKNWKNIFANNFKRMTNLKEIKNLEIELKKSIIKIQNNSGRNIEHVLVRYMKPNGMPMSFEAYIDSETGQTIQTWNKTHYDFKKPLTIDASEFLYKNETE